MLCFDLRRLDDAPIAVDGRLAADDAVWAADDVRPASDVHVTGRLSRAGTGRYYFSGTLKGAVSGECRRCLAPVQAPVSDEAHVVFAEAGDAEILDDPDVQLLDARTDELDLRPAIREEWLLAVPTYLLCREDCLGLCPTCGADRNAGACSCPPTTDHRWDALRVPRDSGL